MDYVGCIEEYVILLTAMAILGGEKVQTSDRIREIVFSRSEPVSPSSPTWSIRDLSLSY